MDDAVTMTAEEYTEAMNRACLVARAVMDIPAGELSQVISRSHAIGPILDPTRYRAGMKNLENQQVIVDAILAAQRRLRDLDVKWEAVLGAAHG